MKATFSVVGIISLVLVCLCIPLTGSTQQELNENRITKDISLTHIDGNTTLSLDLSKHLGLTNAELKKLADSLSIGVLETIPASAKGATIEMLKPLDSTFYPNALVFRKIITNPAKVMDVQIEIKEEKWLNNKDLAEEILAHFDKGKIPVKTEIIVPKNTVLLKIYNTTKSRINLKNWKIRFTYGTIPDDNTDRVIDRMSNVNVEEWKPAKQPKLVEPLYDSYGVTLSRKIDFKLLNDPTKTQDDQLSAISDGTHQIGWEIKKTPNLSSWVEIHDITGQFKHNKEPWMFVVPNENVNIEDLPKVDTQIIIIPRKKVNENQSPTDDR